MTDTYALMRSLCETKTLTRSRQWRPPSETQLDLERSLARAIREFIRSVKLTPHGAVMPNETAHDKLLDVLTRCLERATHEGKHIATGMHERGLISAAKNIAGRAVQLVSDILDTLRDKAQDIIDSLFGSGDVEDVEGAIAEAENQLEEWSANYAEGVAENEIQTVVQEAITDVMRDGGATLLDIVLDPDACKVCREIVEAHPTVSIEDGEKLPPFHFRCRCGAIKHEE